MPEINILIFVLNLFCQGTSPVTLNLFYGFYGGEAKGKGREN